MEQSQIGFLKKGHKKAKEAENILLVYTGYYESFEEDGKRVGDWYKEDFAPYVGHLNEKGEMDDYFFDSFIFLALKTPTKGSLHRYYDWVTDAKLCTKKDWDWILDRMFIKGQQMDALNKAMGEANTKLKGEKKAKIFMVVPFPDPTIRGFGSIDGYGCLDDFSSTEVRNLALKWFTDTFIKRFNESNYENLELCGFYWMQEDLDLTVNGELENLRYIISYLHSKDLKMGWIPWSGAMLKEKGNELGYDFTLIQANRYFKNMTNIEAVKDTAEFAYKNNSGIEIEFDIETINNEWYRQALRDYLIGGVKYGYMKDSVIAYYQGVYGLSKLYHSEKPIGRKLYNEVYEFAKGIYIPVKGDLRGKILDEDGNGIEGALVYSDEKSTTTDENGRYSLCGLSAILTTINIEKQGYKKRSFSIGILEEQIIVHHITLDKI